LPLKIQKNPKKTRFWKEKSVEDMDEFTLGPTAKATLISLKNCQGEEKWTKWQIQGKKELQQ